MPGKINSKVVGSAIIGFALVGAAYTLRDFGQQPLIVPTNQVANIQQTSPQRISITVSDDNNNGIEDWRDEFVTAEPITLDKGDSEYTLPDTVTDKMGVEFFEDIVQSRTYGAFGASAEEVTANTVSQLTKEVSSILYDTSDIDILDDWNDQDIVNYANTAASVIYNNSDDTVAGELEIMKAVTQNGNKERIVEFKALLKVYRGYRDDTLKIPVPKPLIKAHLDLINTYEAIYEDIYAMSLVLEDPVISLLHLKRYQEDALGLGIALQNFYKTIEPYGSLFTEDDPALLFVAFSPDFKN